MSSQVAVPSLKPETTPFTRSRGTSALTLPSGRHVASFRQSVFDGLQALFIEPEPEPMTLSTLLQEIVQHGGFLTDETIGQLAELDRLRQVLVRCGCGRFTCPATNLWGRILPQLLEK